eukprot:3562304-Prymnesium_polylepis.1
MCVSSGRTTPATTILIACTIASLAAMRVTGSSHGTDETNAAAIAGSEKTSVAMAALGSEAICHTAAPQGRSSPAQPAARVQKGRKASRSASAQRKARARLLADLLASACSSRVTTPDATCARACGRRRIARSICSSERPSATAPQSGASSEASGSTATLTTQPPMASDELQMA